MDHINSIECTERTMITVSIFPSVYHGSISKTDCTHYKNQLLI